MKKKHGLSLMELLIATSIFAIIILSIYSAFQTGILSYRKIDSAFEVYQTARIILSRMELDLKNSFAYLEGDSKFSGDRQILSFFTIIDSFENEKLYSNICRLKYEVKDGILKRTCYRGLDALKENPDVEPEELTSEIKEVRFEYALTSTDPDKLCDWQEIWPPDNNKKNTLPLAVKIKLVLIEKAKPEEKAVEFNKTVSLPLGGQV